MLLYREKEKMINLCFLSGRVENKIDLQFIYYQRKTVLEKKHISMVEIELQMKNKQRIILRAYNEIADWIYQNIKQKDYIFIQGRLHSKFIEIEEIILH